MNSQGWTKQTNSCVWLTNKDLICSICKKLFKTIYEIKDKGLFCRNCLTNNWAIIFEDKDYLLIRGLEDVNFDFKDKKIPKTLNKSLRYYVLSRDGFKCKSCGNTSDKSPLNIDHIIPKSKGGTNAPENLQTLCFDCNIGKGARW